MVTRKSYNSWPYRLISPTVWCIAALVLAAVYYVTADQPLQDGPQTLLAPGTSPSASAQPPAESHSIPLSSDDNQFSVPHILSKNDVALYQEIFRAQKKSDWVNADAAIARLSNPILLGSVLAIRYLDHHYNSEVSDLADWLDRYEDHPQAADIYALAIAKDPSLKDELPQPHRAIAASGYGDDNGLGSTQNENAPYTHSWNAGLEAWSLGNMPEAAKLFSGLADHPDLLPPWIASGAAYWSYRSYEAMGDADQAKRYLHQAAKEPRSFYGILACRQLKQSLTLDNLPVRLSDSDILEMIGDPVIRRTIALTEIGEDDLAGQELRAQFPQSTLSEKFRLLALAHQLNLAWVQIGMGKQLSRQGQTLDFARYPIPDWKPEGGFTVDPALILALMRQESGFRVSAVSHGGAMGLMQLMPQTASLMQKYMSHEGNITEPVMNMTLGQNYVRHLLDNDLVQGNLFYLLVAYNAGAGRLQEWKNTIGHDDDPLLFVESIPYPQTRYYVMQVMANYWIYSELTGTRNSSVYALLNNQWPTYSSYIPPVAERKIVANIGG